MNLFELQFGIAIAFASVNALPGITPSELSTGVTKLCAAIPNNKALAEEYYAKAIAKVNENEKYSRTRAYVTDTTNKNKFLAGGDSCKQYFEGLKTPLTADLRDAGVSPHVMVQQHTQFRQVLNQILTEFKAV